MADERYSQKERTETDNAIIVDNLSKQFRIPHERKITVYQHLTGIFHGGSYSYEVFNALQDISFTVKHGETFGIIGPNGSGKSTLLKILAGVLYPDSGRVQVNGKIAPFLELGVGFHPDLTAKENIYLYGAIMGLSKREIASKFDEILEFAELERFESMKLKNFSTGMTVRLAFSTAIQTDPNILLVDEVLSVGDESFQRKCSEKINEFRKDGKTIVFVSHGLGAVKQLCERSILLSHGKINSVGYSEKVVNDYRIRIYEEEELKMKEQKEKIKGQTDEIIVSTEQKTEQKSSGTGKREQHQATRWGSHEIEITDIKIFDGMGNERYFFKTGEKITVQLNYFAKMPIENPTFGVAIFGNDGTYVYGSNTHVDGISFGILEGGGIVTLTYDELNLLNGTFFIDAAIYNNVGMAYDYLKHNYSFKVYDDTGNEGICKISHTYRIIKSSFNT
jgi:lipopolysaccharide transport system ATP-binding protein